MMRSCLCHRHIRSHSRLSKASVGLEHDCRPRAVGGMVVRIPLHKQLAYSEEMDMFEGTHRPSGACTPKEL